MRLDDAETTTQPPTSVVPKRSQKRTRLAREQRIHTFST
jgi:hypothetical protein